VYLVSVFIRGSCGKNTLRCECSLILVALSLLDEGRGLLSQTLSHVHTLVVEVQRRSEVLVVTVCSIILHFLNYGSSTLEFLVQVLQTVLFFLGIRTRVLLLRLTRVRTIVVTIIWSLLDAVKRLCDFDFVTINHRVHSLLEMSTCKLCFLLTRKCYCHFPTS
jgi:hypothetical protein